MNKEEILAKTYSTLKNIFLKYKGKGIISIYLWGSILSEDFNLGKSDIDSVAIVKNNFGSNIGEKIKNFLSEEKSGLKYFKINYLFLEELEGKKPRSRLAKHIHPNLLLLDFRYWKHICGRKFSRSDFPTKEWTYEEAMRNRLKEFYSFHMPKINKRDFSWIEYVCKNLFRVCYLINQINKGSHIFSYKTLIKNSNKKDKELVNLLLKLKKSNWNKKLFIGNLPRLIKLVDKITKNQT